MISKNKNLPFFSINSRGKLVDLTLPKIMGILNVTPDSFSDGGNFVDEKLALKQAEKMILEGAEFIDIGAQSTRPNATKISAKEEIIRLTKVISEMKKEFPDIFVSLDTFYSEVVRFGFDKGIDIINDISGGSYDENMLKTVSETGLPYVLMHSNFNYETMHKKLIVEDIILFLNQYFSNKIMELQKFGIKDIIIDPGFGFGKTTEQQYQMLDELEFIGFGRFPLLVGISRKSFIYKPLGNSPLEINIETQKLHLKALKKGAKILRVHDVKETKETLFEFLKNESKT